MAHRNAARCGGRHAVHLGWLTGAYRYGRYRTAPSAVQATLEVPEAADITYARAAAAAMARARDLVNTPANDLGPAELAHAASVLAKQHGGSITIVEGEALASGFPMIHAVGRASSRAPRLIDLTGAMRRRRVTSSARVCASTAAASTSRPRPACCS